MPDSSSNNERDLFLDAVEIDDETERESFLVNACGEDTEMRNRIDRLIAADQKNSDCFMSEKSSLDDETRQFIRVAAGLDDGLPERTAPPKWSPPTVEAVAHYMLEKGIHATMRLGVGALGALYLGKCTSSGESVTIRIIAPHLCESFAFRSEFSERIRKLCTIRHSMIAPIRKFGDFEIGGLQFYYVVSDFYESPHLADLVAKKSVRSSQIPKLIATLAGALEEGAKSGFQHGGLSPATIFVASNREPRITDYGLNFGDQISDLVALGMWLEACGGSEFNEIAKTAMSGQFPGLTEFKAAIQEKIAQSASA